MVTVLTVQPPARTLGRTLLHSSLQAGSAAAMAGRRGAGETLDLPGAGLAVLGAAPRGRPGGLR